ncbi:hypothetical protein PEDI_37470 [Persicobacter diffluens]|uniref:Uncharacterized protein n=1 Tax=Persicobacter diffluens TaxID=981 RepID=A0AAN4W2A6_9BACT|nr:hypothetical protein PEDI_37470 [Persicobacter diffluens]
MNSDAFNFQKMRKMKNGYTCVFLKLEQRNED